MFRKGLNMGNKRIRLGLVILFGCLSSVLFAEMNYQQADPVWKKEFGYEGFSCFPHLLKVGNNGKLTIVGAMYNQRDRDIIGRVWQWTLDNKTGKRLKDLTLKSAKPKECSALSSFWVTKGLDVLGDNEIQLLVDPAENFLKYKDGLPAQKYKLKVAGGKLYSGRMKRFKANECFVFGSDEKTYGVIQKRNNSNDVIWEKRYQYGGKMSCVSDISQPISGGLVVTGWTVNKDNKIDTHWVNILDNNGTLVTRDEFNITGADTIRTPQVVVLDNTDIAIIYNEMRKGQLTDIKYRIYSGDLELKRQLSVIVDDKNFLFFGVAATDGGFVIVHDVHESNLQYTILHQYDYNGSEVNAIKIDKVGTLGDQILIASKGKMVYLASLKTPAIPPTQTVVTALKLE
jgi:hypothetical protein